MRRPSRPNPTARTTARPSRKPASQAAKAKDRAARIAARQAAKAQDRDARIAARDKATAKTTARVARDQDKRNAAKTAARVARDKATAKTTTKPINKGPIDDSGMGRTPPMQPRKPVSKTTTKAMPVDDSGLLKRTPRKPVPKTTTLPTPVDDSGLLKRTPRKPVPKPINTGPTPPMKPVPQPQPTPAPSVNVAKGPIGDTGMFRMKKGGKVKAVKKSSSGGTAKAYKGGGKVRGYGMARGGKVCKIR